MMVARKFKFGRDAEGNYRGPIKRVHRDKKKQSLALKMFIDGQLDVCLQTGTIWTSFRGRKTKRKVTEHYKGYLYVGLNREKKRGRKNKQGRRREKMNAWVHRLVMMKQLAENAAGEGWRAAIADIDPDIDIDHRDLNRQNNEAKNLRLADHNLHGKRSSENWTAEDEAAVEEFNRGF